MFHLCFIHISPEYKQLFRRRKIYFENSCAKYYQKMLIFSGWECKFQAHWDRIHIPTLYPFPFETTGGANEDFSDVFPRLTPSLFRLKGHWVLRLVEEHLQHLRNHLEHP